jgi:hypothetical protein
MTLSSASVQLRDSPQAYMDESVIFVSPVRNVKYCVRSLDDSGVVISRLDAEEPQRLTFSHYEKLSEKISQSDGTFPLPQLGSSVAEKVIVLQSPCFALSADRKSTVDVSRPERALEVFCDWVGSLRVASDEGKPKLYKPMIIQNVVKGIEAGELSEDKIAFDWIVLRFVKGLADLEIATGEAEAAHGFYHLTNEFFWMHAVYDPLNPMRDGSEGARAVRESHSRAYSILYLWELWILLIAPTPCLCSDL